MLCSGKSYQPDTTDMWSWIEESSRQEERCQEEWKLSRRCNLQNDTAMRKRNGQNRN